MVGDRWWLGHASASVNGSSGAACLGCDPTLWDLDHENHRVQFDRCAKCAEALRICTGCPVRARCAVVAGQLADVYTIRGGWALVCNNTSDPTGTAVPANGCELCGLPVLRGGNQRHCSIRCARWAIAGHRRNTRAAA